MYNYINLVSNMPMHILSVCYLSHHSETYPTPELVPIDEIPPAQDISVLIKTPFYHSSLNGWRDGEEPEM